MTDFHYTSLNDLATILELMSLINEKFPIPIARAPEIIQFVLIIDQSLNDDPDI